MAKKFCFLTDLTLICWAREIQSFMEISPLKMLKKHVKARKTKWNTTRKQTDKLRGRACRVYTCG